MEDSTSDKMISTTVEVIQPQTEEENSCGYNCLKKFLTVFSYVLFVCTFPFSLYFCVKIVREYERAVLFRLGMLRKKETVGPGMFFILPCLDEVRLINRAMTSVNRLKKFESLFCLHFYQKMWTKIYMTGLLVFRIFVQIIW